MKTANAAEGKKLDPGRIVAALLAATREALSGCDLTIIARLLCLPGQAIPNRAWLWNGPPGWAPAEVHALPYKVAYTKPAIYESLKRLEARGWVVIQFDGWSRQDPAVSLNVDALTEGSLRKAKEARQARGKAKAPGKIQKAGRSKKAGKKPSPARSRKGKKVAPKKKKAPARAGKGKKVARASRPKKPRRPKIDSPSERRADAEAAPSGTPAAK